MEMGALREDFRRFMVMSFFLVAKKLWGLLYISIIKIVICMYIVKTNLTVL